MPEPAFSLSSSELTMRLRQQELVAEFGRFALRVDDFQAVLDQASLIAAEGLEARFAKVLEYRPGDMTFLVRSGVGWRDGVVGHATLGGDLLSPAGYAYRSGKPVVSNHLSNEHRFRTPKLLAEHGVHSAVNVLISGVDDSAPFGVLEGDSTRRGDFSEPDVIFLQALANTLAVAVAAQSRKQGREQMLKEKSDLLTEKEALLREKDLLMQEVHHRVMNSLNLVQSLLHMQARLVSQTEAKEQIEEAAGRILTIGAVHRRLHEGDSVTSADASVYLKGLMDDMTGMLPGSGGTRMIELNVPPFLLPADDITPLGLIASELVTNALKYGQGNIRIEVRQQAEGLTISASDEGPGFPPEFDQTARRGMGMRLIASLAKVRNGDAIRIDRSVAFGRVIVETRFGGTGHDEQRGGANP